MVKSVLSVFMLSLLYISKWGIILFLFSCSSDSNDNSDLFIRLSECSLNYTAEKGEKVLEVTATGEWVVDSVPEWVTITPEKDCGTTTIVIEVAVNTDINERNATIRFVAGDYLETLEITQLGEKQDIKLSSSGATIGTDGGEILVIVTANTEWISVIDEDCNWVREDLTSRAMKEGRISFIVDPYDGVGTRTAIVNIRQKDGSIIREFTITQLGEEVYLSIADNYLLVPYKIGLQEIELTTNSEYEIINSELWLAWNQESSSLEKAILQISDNDTSNKRETKLTVRSKKSGTFDNITVCQLGKPDLSIGMDPAIALAFPGAEGAGREVTGGRGGKVLYVTKLTDDNSEGTLRWAIDQTGPRIIVFKVSGIIDLKTTLRIRNNDVTIAGQSAPGDGICIRNYSVVNQANNVIVRFIRFRMGDLEKTEDDAMWGREQKNIILDHCSFSWSTDECASFYDNVNFTMQWCILSESLRNSIHGKGQHGFGGIWGGKNATFHHNLLAHHDSRNPRMCGSRFSNSPEEEKVDFRNNVLFNWGSKTGYAGEGGEYNFINNYYRPGPASANTGRIFQPDPDNGGNKQPAGVWGKFYLNGNYMLKTDGTPDHEVNNNNTQGLYINKAYDKDKNELLLTKPFVGTPSVTTHSAESAYKKVIKSAGASFFRDPVDVRVANEAYTGNITYTTGSNGSRGGLIDSQSDVGGWPEYVNRFKLIDIDNDGIPDIWEDAYGLDKNDASDAVKKTLDPKGVYTNIEVYLHNLVQDIIREEVNL